MIKRLGINWTDDCSGKKDYDGDLVSISTRYWPSSYQTNGLCSAHCSILLLTRGSHESGHARTLAQKEFEGPTFVQVAAQAEVWALEQANKVATAMLAAFPDAGEEEES